MSVTLTISDALAVIQIVERASEKGLFKGVELLTVGQLFATVQHQLDVLKNQSQQTEEKRNEPSG